MNRNLYLEGDLGATFGKQFPVYAKTPQEAIKLLDANFSGFKQYLLDAHDKGIGFTVEVAGDSLDEKGLFTSVSAGDIIISPVPAGSKSGPAKILAAIVLVVAATMVAGPGGLTGALEAMTTAGATMTGAQVAAVAMATMGINLAMMGIQQIMAPDPGTDTQEPQSYLFNGSQQNIVEGDPVPVLYGELRVPGRPIGFGIVATGNQLNSTIPDSDSQDETDSTVTTTDSVGNIDTNPSAVTNTGDAESTVNNEVVPIIPPKTVTSVTGPTYATSGETITFTVVTSNIPDETILDWEISTDKGLLPYPATGSVKITNNTGTFQTTVSIQTVTTQNLVASVYSTTHNVASVDSNSVLYSIVTISGPDTITETGGPYEYTVSFPGFGSGDIDFFITGTGLSQLDQTNLTVGNTVFDSLQGTVSLTSDTGILTLTTLENETIDSETYIILRALSSDNLASPRLGQKTVYITDDSIPADVTPGDDTTDDSGDTTIDPKLDLLDRPGDFNNA